ncbi:O-antigen ligase family protein [Acetobacter sp. AC2005]|uniref:O-antigen ligase family protein n=1 Tax=Acetobacter sp. AC2005 TaxID=3134142 RepID=UPI0030D043B2
MPLAVSSPLRVKLAGYLTAAGLVCLSIFPFFLFYSRALSDTFASVIGGLFLLHCCLLQNWQWVKQPWLKLAALFCGLCLLSSVHIGITGAWVQALCLPRLFLFCVALQCWLLATEARRIWLERICLLAALWLISQCWQQYLTGTNMMGMPRWGDGSLTGPFTKPRAGFTLLMLFFPGIMPSVLRLLRHNKLQSWGLGCALLLFGVTTMVLIGQRMSCVLLFFGLSLTAFIFPRFRLPFGLILACAGGLIASLPVISPPVYAKLVLKFSDQLHHFAQSDYGKLFRSAITMVAQHPWMGLGMDGFRNFCHVPIQTHAFSFLGIETLTNDTDRGCNIHPHNYYLQIATTAGLPGLMVFIGLAFQWLRTGWRALDVEHYPQQAMLFVTCCILLWPITSTSAVFSFPTAGWIFMFVGWLIAASSSQKRA